jgi:predicted permease
VLLVIAAGLLARSLWALSHVDPGFRAEHRVTARISPNAAVCQQPERCLAFYRELEDRARTLPGVDSAAVVSTLPLGGLVVKRSLRLEGHEPGPGEANPLFWLSAVSSDYFRVMGTPLQAGTTFTPDDLSANRRVAIVSAATARRFWPNTSAVGKQIRFIGETDWRTIVGIVADVRGYDLRNDVPAWIDGTIYVPHSQTATHEDGRIPSEMTLVVRTVSDPSSIGSALAPLVGALSREVAVSDVKSMGAFVAESVAAPASTTSLFVIFGALALVLGSIGVYGVLSFLVSKRTREIGVRLALGAQPGDISRLVLREGAKVGLTGIVCGVAGAFAISRVLENQLYGVSPVDPVTYAAVALVVAGVTFAACYVPMRRAMRVDPLVALRNE